MYNLSTCLTKVDELIAEKKLENYKKTQVKCKFKRFVTKPALEIVITQPTHGNIGVEGKTKVKVLETILFHCSFPLFIIADFP